MTRDEAVQLAREKYTARSFRVHEEGGFQPWVLDAIQAAAERGALPVPDGWQLAPIEPTAAMTAASYRISSRDEGAEHWAAMLAAAPAVQAAALSAPDGVREALAELVAMYFSEAPRTADWFAKYHGVWTAAREALSAQPAPTPEAKP